jgi:large subunit ribosomal protein L10
MASTKKVEQVADITLRLEGRPNFILIAYSGMTVKSLQELRSKLRETGSEMKVIKNNLFLRALKESSKHSKTKIAFNEKEYFGPMAAVFGNENLPDVAKVCKDYSKTNEKLVMKLGYFDGEVLDSKGVEAIAGLPSREELLSIIARGLNTPAQRIATGINQIMASLARGIQAVAEKNGK